MPSKKLVIFPKKLFVKLEDVPIPDADVWFGATPHVENHIQSGKSVLVGEYKLIARHVVKVDVLLSPMPLKAEEREI